MGQAYPDRHSTSYTDSWVSCQQTTSPNDKREDGHWIMYDLGDQYSLHGSTLWNYNVPDTTNRGVKDIVIDYSNNATDWTELAEFTAVEAPGSAFYQGDEGPDFDGVIARYVLVSILNNHGAATCVGMSEFRINATITTSTNIPDNDLDINLLAQPNPASAFTIISINGNDAKLNYSLTDMNGKLIRQGAITEKEMKLNTASLISGTYSLTVYNIDGKKSILIHIVH